MTCMSRSTCAAAKAASAASTEPSTRERNRSIRRSAAFGRVARATLANSSAMAMTCLWSGRCVGAIESARMGGGPLPRTFYDEQVGRATLAHVGVPRRVVGQGDAVTAPFREEILGGVGGDRRARAGRDIHRDHVPRVFH